MYHDLFSFDLDTKLTADKLIPICCHLSVHCHCKEKTKLLLQVKHTLVQNASRSSEILTRTLG